MLNIACSVLKFRRAKSWYPGRKPSCVRSVGSDEGTTTGEYDLMRANDQLLRRTTHGFTAQGRHRGRIPLPRRPRHGQNRVHPWETTQMERTGMTKSLALAAGLLAALAAGILPAPAMASTHLHTTGMVNGVKCDIWTWTDSSNKKRTVALKMEGNGNSGHGGYAVQMTYYYYDVSAVPSPWVKVTVNAANESDGGFG